MLVIALLMCFVYRVNKNRLSTSGMFIGCKLQGALVGKHDLCVHAPTYRFAYNFKQRGGHYGFQSLSVQMMWSGLGK